MSVKFMITITSITAYKIWKSIFQRNVRNMFPYKIVTSKSWAYSKYLTIVFLPLTRNILTLTSWPMRISIRDFKTPKVHDWLNITLSTGILIALIDWLLQASVIIKIIRNTHILGRGLPSFSAKLQLPTCHQALSRFQMISIHSDSCVFCDPN